MRLPTAVTLLLTLPVLALSGCAPTGSEAPTAAAVAVAEGPRYETRTPSEGGTGRVYMGREIAQVMGHEGADWLERTERLWEERPDLLLDALELESGDVVADIGAGSGYFSLPVARRVGPGGRVLAVDIQPEMLALLGQKAGAEGLLNIEGILGTENDPRLPAGEVDLALVVDAYHEFSEPYAMIQGIVDGLVPGGRLVLVEYRGEDEDLAIKPLHKMTEEQVHREMEPFPLRWVETLRMLPTQHVMVFEKI